MSDVEGRIVLGLDIAQTTQQMNQDLSQVLSNIGKKEIKLSAKIDNVNFGNAAAQIRNVTSRINQEFSSTLGVIDLVNGGIENLSKILHSAGFAEGSISTVTKDLQSMSLQVSKITTSLAQNGNITLKITGKDDLQRTVNVIKQYDAETGKVVDSTRTFVQTFTNSAKAADTFARSVEKVENAFLNNSIEASIAKVTTQFEQLGTTGHARLTEIQADIQTLNVLQNTMATTSDNKLLVSSYEQYEQVLARVKNNLSVVVSETSRQSETVKNNANDLSASLHKIETAISTNQIEAAITGVTAQFDKLSSSGHTKLAQIQTDLQTLNSLQTTMTTTTDNTVLISSYEQYEQVLARVQNNLKIVTTATKEQAAAAKEAAVANNTMMKSTTLSNKIEAWMNQNTAAAQRFGEEIRKNQAALANNQNPAQLTSLSAEFAKIQAQAKAAGLVTNQFAQSVKNVGLQLLGLTSGVAALRKLIQMIRDGINTVIELDTALIDLKKTTTMSGSDLATFYKDANKAAKELGVTTKDIIQSAADWSRLGFSDKTSSETMAKLAAQFSAISPGVDIDSATTGLVSVIKAYDIDVNKVLDDVMSKINIIGNTAATSNKEIITGLQRSASAMSAMNSTLEENIALFTAAQEIVQNDSQVGNAIRTISMRIRGYDEETEQLSEDLVNIAGEVIELTKTASNSQGISLFTDETQTEYKSVYQYLKEISEIYDELGAKQQQKLMDKLFGKMRANVGQAILQNFEAAEKAMNNMADSAGNADAEMEIIKQSLEYKLNALKETGVGIFQELFPREDIGVAIDALTGLLSIIGALTSLLGPFGTALAGVGLAAFIKNLG